ncbi:MAG: hypothetical protein MI725_02660 [Pirellulales bacterium]|nr:hypothetical protein [Pirellulales bacterium]
MSRLRRFRFSLRFLLVAMVLSAGILYWVTLPSVTARRYVTAINAGDFATANRLCSGSESPFPGENAKQEMFRPHAALLPLSLHNVLHGTRDLYVSVVAGNDDALETYGVFGTASSKNIRVETRLP